MIHTHASPSLFTSVKLSLVLHTSDDTVSDWLKRSTLVTIKAMIRLLANNSDALLLEKAISAAVVPTDANGFVEKKNQNLRCVAIFAPLCYLLDGALFFRLLPSLLSAGTANFACSAIRIGTVCAQMTNRGIWGNLICCGDVGSSTRLGFDKLIGNIDCFPEQEDMFLVRVFGLVNLL